MRVKEEKVGVEEEEEAVDEVVEEEVRVGEVEVMEEARLGGGPLVL